MTEFSARFVLAITAGSSLLTAFQLIQSVKIADYRQALAFHGDAAAAKRIILPCYRPLFISLITLYLLVAI